jgi:CRISPR-associated endonuclease/helicase Cas3
MTASQKPFPFQERVAEHLLAGRNVILQAPTGAGKTRAALLPWLQATERNNPEQFPLRCIYSVPMRVLANQFVESYQEKPNLFGIEWGRDDVQVNIQTGEAPNDPKFEDTLIFATLDQTLSSALGIPYSQSLGSANLNAGAVMSSYLVWDEFHLFGREQALPTTLHLLRMLRGITPFCLMTATFSQTLLGGLAQLLNAEVVTVSAEERDKIPSQKGKERTFRVVDTPLTADAILANFNRRAIAICNTVDRAQQLYVDLLKVVPPGTEVRLLHSRFYQEDRQRITKWVHKQFAEGWSEQAEAQERAILVATQVVEVGMDITCETLHTELAPANTLVQRAGRCARFAGERGEVRIYALPVDEAGNPQTAPYDIEKEANLCEKTWSAFSNAERNGNVLDYDVELDILEEVHCEDDQELLKEITDKDKAYKRRKMMMEAMANHDYREARHLIREIDNRSLIIHPDPKNDESLKRSPWAYEALSISTRSFYVYADGRKEPHPSDPRPWLSYQEEEVDWTLMYPKLVDGGDGNERRNGPPLFEWCHATKHDLRGNVIFAIHPSLVTYSSELGLRLEPDWDSTHIAPLRDRKAQNEQNYSYHLETYEEHISALWQICSNGFYDTEKGVQRSALLDEVAYALPRLAQRCNCTGDDLLRLLKWIIAGHDVGKLGQGWQDWVKRWQTEKIGGAYDPSECYAHLEFDGSEDHKKLQDSMPKRPPHAAQSAVALINVLAEITNENSALWQAALTALTRHHTAKHKGEIKQDWKANPSVAVPALQQALQAVSLEDVLVKHIEWEIWNGDGIEGDRVAADQLQVEAVFAYLWFSRLLRLSDQRSLQI